MATVERVTREGLSLTPATRRYARRAGLWLSIGCAFMIAFGLFIFGLVLSEVLEGDQATLGFGGVLISLCVVVMWGLLVALIGYLARNAYRVARDGTYTRYFGPFTLREEYHQKGGVSYWLDLGEKSVTLAGSWRPRSDDIITLSVLGSGVVDWIPSIGVLAVWDDHGKCVYRARSYKADPDISPPPPGPARPARVRMWPEG